MRRFRRRARNRMHALSPESPRWFLTFGCGCKKDLTCLKEANEHAEECGHTVTIRGNLRLAGHGPNPTHLINSGLLQSIQFRFPCGDGFNSHSLEKAVEHATKSGHNLQIHGKINPGLKRASRASAPCRPRAELYTVEAYQKVPGSKKEGRSEEDSEVVIWTY